MLQAGSDAVMFKTPIPWPPMTVLECVDEIQRISHLIAGLDYMVEVAVEDNMSITNEEVRNRIKEAYAGIISREMEWAQVQLDIVAEALHGDIKRRRRLRKVVYRRKARK